MSGFDSCSGTRNSTLLVLIAVLVGLSAANASATDRLFDAARTFAAGDIPQSVTAGNFDGDANLDLAVANYGSNNISILLSNGDGTFAAAMNYAAGAGPYSVTAGDFDGDANLDLAVANSNGDNVSILLGNGDGTFATALNYAAGASPFSVTAGDFDGDAKLDLAVTNSSGDNVSIFLGDGDGTFAVAMNYAAGALPFSVTAGDFDGDAMPDLAVANFFDDNVSVLVNLSGTLTGVMLEPSLPRLTLQLDNRPNPFNSRTVIAYSIPSPGHVSLHIYDLAGRLVQTLVDEPETKGEHELTWDGRDHSGQQTASGVYFMKLRTSGEVSMRKIVLLK